MVTLSYADRKTSYIWIWSYIFQNVVFDPSYFCRRMHEHVRSSLLAKYKGKYFKLSELAEEFKSKAEKKE